MLVEGLLQRGPVVLVLHEQVCQLQELVLVHIGFVRQGFCPTQHGQLVAGQHPTGSDVLWQRVHPHAHHTQGFGHGEQRVAVGPDVMVATTTAHEVQQRGVWHPSVVDDVVAKVHFDNLGEHQLSRTTLFSQGFQLHHLAFQLDRRLGHTGGRNVVGRQGRQPRLHEFVHPLCVVGARERARVNHGVVNQVHHHLRHALNVVPCVLGAAIPAATGR